MTVTEMLDMWQSILKKIHQHEIELYAAKMQMWIKQQIVVIATKVIIQNLQLIQDDHRVVINAILAKD